MTKAINPEAIALIGAAVDGNADLIGSAIALEHAAENFDQHFITSAKAFAAARDGKVTVAALAKALKARAGESSVSLRGVQWFTSNASIEAHAWTGRFYALPGSLEDVGPSDVQTLITQTYNVKGGSKVIAQAMQAEDQEAALKALRAALKALKDAEKAQDEGEADESEGEAVEASLEDILSAVAAPLAKAVALAEQDGVSAEAARMVRTLWTALAAIDAVADHAALADEAADEAAMAS